MSMVVYKPFTPRRFKPAGWIIALAATAAIAIGAAGGGPTHGIGTTSHFIDGTYQAPARGAQQSTQLRATFGGLPLAFEPNQGQADQRVRYMASGEGYTLFLTADDAVFALKAPSRSVEVPIPGNHYLSPTNEVAPPISQGAGMATIHMRLVGVRDPRIAASNQLPGRTNYFIGNDFRDWHTNVPQYARISYRDVYPGVSLAFHGMQRQLEFDFIVSAWANPAPIRFGVSGASKIEIDDGGNLLLSSSAGDVTLHRPVAYQQEDGVRHPVNARFRLLTNNQVGFELGSYDRSRDLVIDPSVSYATYLGGSADDQGNAIAIDASGNAYITGQTASTNFPVVTGGYSGTNTGGLDVFVTKISADGSTLLYSTYVGGSGNDAGNAIAVSASGAAFVAGETASATDFPTTNGAFQTTFGGGGLDAFVFELNSAGSALTYSTYLGGSGDDIADGVALDSSGNTYIVGSTTSTNFPVLNAIQTTPDGVAGAFVTKLNSSGSGLVFSTYLGGSENDFASAVALDSLNNVYVTGATQNPNFPVTAGAFQTKCGTDGNCNGGLADAFVTVFKAAGSGFIYSTFLGGEGIDQGFGIAVDSSGDAYVTGLTLSTAFPTKSPIQLYGGDQDAFVTAFNPSGNALLYSTYLGGSLNDAGTGIAIDGSKNVYVTGQTGSSDFPTTNPTQPQLGGDNDAFVTEINAAGSARLFSTYLGGSLNENTSTAIATGNLIAEGAIAVDGAGANIYVTGDTFSTDFPTESPEQAANGGEGDAFIAKYAQANFTIAVSDLNPAFVNPGGSATSTITIAALNGFNSAVALTCSVSPATAKQPTCSLNPTSVTPGTPSSLTVTTTASTTTANYTVSVTGTSSGFVHTATTSFSVQDFSVAASAMTPAMVNPGGSANSTITVTPTNGFSKPVDLTCSVSPASANSPTCGLNPASVTPATSSILTVAAPASAPGAVYTITVTGAAGSDVHTTTAKLTVNGFLISATAPAAVNPGSSSTSTVTLTALNGYSLAVDLSCSVSGPGSPPPACNAQNFSPNPVTPTVSGVQTILTITTTAPAKSIAGRAHFVSIIWFPTLGLSFISLCLVAVNSNRRKLAGTLFLGMFVISVFGALPSCGGSGAHTCSAAPISPTGLGASSTTSTGTTLTWAAATVGANCSVTGYTIYQNGSQIGTSAATSFNVTGLSPSTTYSFSVSASDSAGTSAESSPLSVTTGSGATPPGSYTITITGTDMNGLSNFTQVNLTVI